MSNPKSIDKERLLIRVIDAFDIDMSKIKNVYGFGSFFKEGDYINSDSDIDILFVIEEDNNDPINHNISEKVEVLTNNGFCYGKREVHIITRYEENFSVGKNDEKLY
jgi:predicted nucleotidyltransferase